MTKNSEKGKPRLHTTISKETEQLLDKYAELKDENGEYIYGNKSKVIEKAIELLDKYHEPRKEDIQDMWNRARTELNMVSIGKWTFFSLIKGEATVNENLALDIIEWYAQKTIDEIHLVELLEIIKELWVSMNYFRKIRINVGSKNSYQMTFLHDFHGKEYSEYWGLYFNKLLLTYKNCDIEYFLRKTSLILRINPSKS